jgi:ribA/ribD-fused uncharacterized protein
MILKKEHGGKVIYGFNDNYSFLSNFYKVEIRYDNIIYPSVEHFYVAMKSNSNQIINGIEYSDLDYKKLISSIESPGMVKKIGRNIEIRKDWDVVKSSIMYKGLKLKFKHNHLKEMLLNTNDYYIIEANYWHDNYWGSCYCPKCNSCGNNNLGKMLMTLRKELNTNFIF